MAISEIILSAIISRISIKINMKVSNEIRADIYDRIINTDWESMSSYRSGDLLNRLSSDTSTVAGSVLGWIPSLIINITQFVAILSVILYYDPTMAVLALLSAPSDTSTVAGSVLGWIPSLIINITQFVAILSVILYYDPTMAVLALLSAPVTLIISKVLMKRMRNQNKKMMEISSEMMSFNEETFSNLQSIKAFNLIDTFSNRLRNIQSKYTNANLEYNKFSIYTSSFMSLVGMVVSYSCFGWGVYRLWTGNITYGTMTLFLQLSGSLTSSFSSLVGLVPSAISATTSAGRIMEIVELPRETIKDEKLVDDISKSIDLNELEIEVKDVNFRYLSSDKTVLENANIKAKSGEIIALVGPSGEGKTTMMRILLGLLNIKEGNALIKVKDNLMCNISSSTRKLMAYVPQEKTMFSGTIAENMRMVKPNATDSEIINALEIACAYEFVEKLPDGINSKIGERGSGFSEGQNQRLSIARALLRNSPILLLDEATSALDVATERKVLKNIMKLKQNRICIVTTHRPSVLTMCDRVYKISQSKVTIDVATERKVLKNIMKLKQNRICIVTTHRPSVLTMCDRVYKISQSKVTTVYQEEVEQMVVDF